MSTATCLVCTEPVRFFSVGPCNHREVCHRCSLRLRGLYGNAACSYCKTKQPQVVFTSDPAAPFDELLTRRYATWRKLNVLCETSELLQEVTDLLRFKCPLDTCGSIFDARGEAERHIRKDHPGLALCNVCVDNRKVFFNEHKLYTRAQLDKHYRQGDDDDPAFRGHERCSFCRLTFYGKDELYNHLEKEHFYCFLCHGNGVHNQYYADYANLEQHFDEDHFLCPYAECREKAFIAFATEIGLKNHLASEHLKDRKLSRSQQKQYRTIQLDFNYGGQGGQPAAATSGSGSRVRVCAVWSTGTQLLKNTRKWQQQREERPHRERQPREPRPQPAQPTQPAQPAPSARPPPPQPAAGASSSRPTSASKNPYVYQRAAPAAATPDAGSSGSSPSGYRASARPETQAALEEIDGLDVGDDDDEDEDDSGVVLVAEGQDVDAALAEQARVEQAQREQREREQRRVASRKSSEHRGIVSDVDQRLSFADGSSAATASSARPPPGFEGRCTPSTDGSGRPPPGFGGAQQAAPRPVSAAAARMDDLKRRAPSSFTQLSSRPANGASAAAVDDFSPWEQLGRVPSPPDRVRSPPGVDDMQPTQGANGPSPSKLQIDLKSGSHVSAFASMNELDPLAQRRQRDFLLQLQSVFGEDRDKFDNFRAMTRAFRAGSISAPAFYEQWLQYVGPQAEALFQQLVDLVPDEALRQQLVTAHRNYSRPAPPTQTQTQKQAGGSRASSSSSSSSSSGPWATAPRTAGSSFAAAAAKDKGKARVLVIKAKAPSGNPSFAASHMSVWDAGALARPFICPYCKKIVPAPDKEWHLATHPIETPSNEADSLYGAPAEPELAPAPQQPRKQPQQPQPRPQASSASARQAPSSSSSGYATAWASGSSGPSVTAPSLSSTAFPTLQQSSGKAAPAPAPVAAPVEARQQSDDGFPALPASGGGGGGKKKSKKTTLLYIG